MSAIDETRVSAATLRWQLDPSRLPFETTAELDPCEDIIGQEQAVAAIRLGLDLRSFGYNIFITGLVGTGRMTVVQRLLAELAANGSTAREPLQDFCYVNNFKSPDMPRLLRFAPGDGSQFAKAMERFVTMLRKQLPQVFESEAYVRERKERLRPYREEQSALIGAFQKQVESEGFAVIQVQMGPITRPDVLPQVEGQPVALEQLDDLVTEGKLPAEQATSLREKHKVLSEALGEVAKQMRAIERKVQDEVEALNRSIVQEAIREALREIRDRFPTEAVSLYLSEVEEHVIEHLGRSVEEEKSEGDETPSPFHSYHVNVILDNSGSRSVPIVTETHPSYGGLFGTVEAPADREFTERAGYSHLRAGSLVRADGGFLILNAIDVLSEPGVWPALKRTLRTGQVEIRPPEHMPFPWGTAIKPDPIGIRTKVVMIGDVRLYSLLYELDEDFRKIFKVKAEFDADMDRTPAALDQYARFIAKICASEKLPPFDRGAVAHVVEYGVRRAGRQDRLSTHFTFVKDVIVEAGFWARQDKAPVVEERHVQRALTEQLRRVNLAERKVKDAIARGELIITTAGERIAQLNGLAVYSLGDYSFGVPTRITASVGVGRAGIINIEREAALSGSTHDKGVLILSGFLRARFAREIPLALSASLCFEQSYGGVDGDSASSTEIYALMSALADLPLRQDIAITGSVNQHGEVQPIGGVNEKVEGFFDICRMGSPTGSEGVLIPRRNLHHLMLREDIVDAVAAGQFHVYAIESVDEGLEVLTGHPAGKRGENGLYPAESVNGRVEARLRELAERVKPFALGETL